jgi:hypothetical protein
MKRTILVFLVIFLFATMALAKDGDPKSAVVGVWTMGFCKAESPAPYPLPFGCTTQFVNFHEDGSVWSSYMYDQNQSSRFGNFGGISVGATGRWYHLGNNMFLVTMLRFINDHASGQLTWILRTDFTVEAYPKIDEAVTGKMSLQYFEAMTTKPFVVKKDPYADEADETYLDLPTGIPMKRLPDSVPDSPVLH